ncbi:sensory neuron membrane protein 1-like [Culicoides brevitarsis]|uniref:sensory neuron membrane protein 1-like n=1 Tax=Culicoides brevitarsis TaxID=469753 RepID=UPI00307BC398
MHFGSKQNNNPSYYAKTITMLEKVWLKKGSFMRRIYDDMPFPIDFNVYLFNITNPDEVASGELPKLQEVGPYRFREWKKRIDQSEDNAEDSLTYTLIDRFELIDSNGLTGQETIVMPHMIIMSTLVLIKKDREPMLPLVSKALETIFKDPNMIFMTATAMDIMFNGLLIKCDSEDFGAKAFCVALETEAKGLEMLGDRKFAFSLFGLMLTTCMVIDICRSLGPHYLRKSKVTGIPTGLYSVDFTIDKNNSEELCYCSDPPDECPEDGTMDLQPCLNAPIVATKPYFLGAPESYSSKMNLNPLPHKHDIIVHLDPVCFFTINFKQKI